MEDQNTNINPEKQESSVPISPDIPEKSPELSTGTTQPQEAFVPPELDAQKPQQATEPAPIQEPEAPAPASPALIMEEEKPRPVPQEKKESFFKKNQKTIKTIAIVLVSLLILGGIVSAYLFFFQKSTLTIRVDQSPIDISVAGQTHVSVSSPHTVKIPRGVYEVTINKEGFLSSFRTIEIRSLFGEEVVDFNLQPQPEPLKIIEEEPFFPAINKDNGRILYFAKGEGARYSLKEYDPETQDTVVIMEPIVNITKIVWSPSYRQFAAKVINSSENSDSILPFSPNHGEGTRLNWMVNTERRDLVNIEKTLLDPGIKNISFGPEGNKMVYFFQRGEARYISTANLDGSSYEPIAQVQSIDFEPDVVWSPDDRRIAYFVSTELGSQGRAESVDVFVYDFSARQKIDVSNDGVSSGALFSPDGSRMIYESAGQIRVYNFNESDPLKADRGLDIKSSVANNAWIDNQNLIIYDMSAGTIFKTKITGEKEDIGYRKDSIPTNVKNVLLKDDKIYLFTLSGVYQFEMGRNI